MDIKPIKVATAISEDATGWSPQRKVCFDGTYFWVFYYYGYDPVIDPTYPYHTFGVSSLDGSAWSEPQLLVHTTNINYRYLGAGLDMRWDSSLSKGIASFPLNDTFYYFRCGFAGGTLVREYAGGGQLAAAYIVAPRHGYIQNRVVSAYQGMTPAISIKKGDNIVSNSRSIGAGQAHQDPKISWNTPYSNSTGGALTLTYEVGGNDQAIYVMKIGNDQLYWGYCTDHFTTFPPTSMETTLASGFNSLSGCSETELGSGTGKLHIVYIKSTGELCHRSFENGAWNDEEELISSGASCPVIACGESNRLYVFYIKDSKIYLKKYASSTWLGSEVFRSSDHTYNNPAFLSSNGVAEDGQICLVWTEEGNSYDVYFSSFEDGEPSETETQGYYVQVKIDIASRKRVVIKETLEEE